MISDKEIGQNIRNLRELRNFSQDSIAIQLDISQKQFSRIENGQVSVSVQTLFKICNILEVEPGFLLEFDPAKIFNNNTINQSGGEHNAGNKSIDQLKNLYEKLLAEKDEIIQLLKKH